MRNGLWFRAKGYLFLPEEGKVCPIVRDGGLFPQASLPLTLYTMLSILAKIALAGMEPVPGVEIDVDILHSNHLPFRKHQSHMWP